MKIEELIRQPNVLPSPQKVVQELISSFNNDQASTDEIAQKLAADPVLSAKLLRLSNSAFYGFSRSVNSVNDAVVMLGFATIRTLVISSGFVNSFKSAPGMDLNQFWNYCLNTAVIAKWLANKVGVNPELAFTVGMTHAVGQLIIHAGIPEKSLELDKAVNPLETRRFDMERLALGFNYAEVSAALADQWHFPKEFADSIRSFPKPLKNDPFNELSAVLHLASWFARGSALKFTPLEMRPIYPSDIANKLGLAPFILLDEMPALSELTVGLEELLS